MHGPEDLTFTDVAAVLTRATGRQIELRVVADQDIRDSLLAAGIPGTTVEGIVEMTSGLRDDFTPEQPRSVLTTTPTTLSAWAHVHLRPLLQK